MPPHVECRLDAPLRELAQDVADWRGMSSLKLAELYARQRENEQKLTDSVAAVQCNSEPRSETEGAQNWLNLLRRWMGII